MYPLDDGWRDDDEGWSDDNQDDWFDKFNKSWINQPLLGHSASEAIAKRNERASVPEAVGKQSFFGLPYAQVAGFGRGAEEGLVQSVEGFSTPLNLATMAAGVGASKYGLAPLTYAERIMSAPVALSGMNKMTDPNSSASERFFGLTEFAGGNAGMMAPFHTGAHAPSSVTPKLTPFDHPLPPGKEHPSTWEGYGPKSQEFDLPLNNSELPANFGPDAYAGPERRSTGERTPATDTIFQAYRDRLARGEDVRSKESLELFNKKQSADDFREQAGKAEEAFTQVNDEIGDIVVDKQGNEHQLMGISPNGKQIWKLTGNKDIEGPTADQIVSEIPPEPVATPDPGLYSSPAEVRQSFGERLARVRTQYGAGSSHYRKLEGEFKSALAEAEKGQGDLFGLQENVYDPNPPKERLRDVWDDLTPTTKNPQLNDLINQKIHLEELRRKDPYGGFTDDQFEAYENILNKIDKHPDLDPAWAARKESARRFPKNKVNIDPGSFEAIQDEGPNASGESAASAEAISRNRGMAARGEKFVVYDRAGRRRELIGPEAVDFHPVVGETFGIEYNDGRFSPLEHRGGKPPVQDFKTGMKDTLASIRKAAEPQEMRVPGTAVKGGLDNVAMGGADPRVLDILGTNLYSKDSMVIAVKELIQNTMDELRFIKSKAPIKLGFLSSAKNPRTNKGGPMLNIKDEGRGLNPEQIYTIFTDIGKSGKLDDPDASGGFGFAKASPMLGGDLIQVESVVMEKGRPVKYTFEGTPKELKNQSLGVPLKRINVDPATKTGLNIKVFYPDTKSTYQATNFLESMVTNSSDLPVDVHTWSGHSAQDLMNDFMNGTMDPAYYDVLKPKAKEPLQGTLDLPNAKINIHFEYPKSGETSSFKLHVLNKGLYQHSSSSSYGPSSLNGVPKNIVADVISKVEEGDTNLDYPFSSNREQLNEEVSRAIAQWIKKNVVEGAQQARVDSMQKMYDEITPINPKVRDDFHWYDSGNILNDQEKQLFADSAALMNVNAVLNEVNKSILRVTDTLKWGWEYPLSGMMKDPFIPSKRLQKFGILMQAPDMNGSVTLGIHIPNPAELGKSAILVNLFETLNIAKNHPNPVDFIATELYTTIAHEHAHLPGGGHDQGFAYRDAKLRGELGKIKTVGVLREISDAFSGLTGGINPGLSDLLSVYNNARKRATSGSNDLISSGIGSIGPTNKPGGKGSNAAGSIGSSSPIKPTGGRATAPITPQAVAAGRAQLYQMQNAHRMAPPGPVKQNLYQKMRDFNKTLLTSMDVSGVFRQGLPLIAEPEYWRAVNDMFKSAGSQAYYDAMRANIDAAPWSQKRYQPVINKAGQRVISPVTKTAKLKELPAFYDEWGLDLAHREETQGSKAAENIPLVGMSNRAYSGLLTKSRYDIFNRMAADMNNMGVDITKNIPSGKFLAEFINKSSGRGNLAWLGKHAELASEFLFAPRLMAAKVQRWKMLADPRTWQPENAVVRKALLKSLVSTSAFGLAFGVLGAAMGASVSTDPTNSDFGKVRVGNTRIDPWAGDQQYAVAMARILTGKYTSPNSPNYGRQAGNIQEWLQNAGTVGGRFARNKLSPVYSLIATALLGKDTIGRKFDPATHIPEQMIPLIFQDFNDLVQEDPNLIPLGILPLLGISIQTFDEQSRFRK